MKPSTELDLLSSTGQAPGCGSSSSKHPGVYRLTNVHSAASVARPSRLVNMGIHNSDFKQVTPSSRQSTNPAIATPIDTKALEMSIAADYTAASINAAKASLPPDSADNQNELSLAIRQYRGASSIDEVARTAAEAIASIRNATDPEDIAQQITALKKFSDQIKKDDTIPEMQGLSETLEKFITVVTKSTGVKLIEEKPAAVKIVAKPKVVTQHTVKSISKPTVSTTTKKVVVGRSITRPTIKTSVKTPAKPLVKAPIRKATTSPRRELPHDDIALRKALRSVATMDSEKSSKAKAHTAKVAKKTTKTSSRSAARAKKEARAYAKASRRQGTGKRFVLALGCAAACVAAVIYCVSSNMPDISVRVAAMQTGVEASYPSYIPRDFSLEGINSENGKITLSFVGPDNAKFTLIEEKSSWDSTALLRNYVEPTWHESYTTTHEQGITIYINGSNAAWVNGGVLYKINSANNTLTKKQLRNIVTSMQ